MAQTLETRTLGDMTPTELLTSALSEIEYARSLFDAPASERYLTLSNGRTLDIATTALTSASVRIMVAETKVGSLESHEDLDTESSASRQHFIDTGRYLRKGEAL